MCVVIPAPPFSDVGSIWNSDADARNVSRSLPDPVEVDGEKREAPNVKKQRLDGLCQNDMCGFRYDLGCMTAVALMFLVIVCDTMYM